MTASECVWADWRGLIECEINKVSHGALQKPLNDLHEEDHRLRWLCAGHESAFRIWSCFAIVFSLSLSGLYLSHLFVCLQVYLPFLRVCLSVAFYLSSLFLVSIRLSIFFFSAASFLLLFLVGYSSFCPRVNIPFYSSFRPSCPACLSITAADINYILISNYFVYTLLYVGKTGA